MMLQRLVDAKTPSVELLHVRLAFSRTLEEVGRFHPGKLLHLILVILQVIGMRLRHRPQVLYYPPAGPQHIPMWRDIVFLCATRWLFDKTVFHMQAGGLSQMRDRLNPLARWLFDRAYLQPDVVIRLSQQTPEDGEGLRARHEVIVPNCVEDEFERFQDVRGRRSGPPRVLSLGTVCEEKGILDLLEACGRLQARSIPFHLDIVGSFQPAQFEKVVRSRVQQLNLGRRVTIHGQLIGDAKFELLAGASLFCMPSYYHSEAFPCVLVEALSFALPVVATRWRGIPTIVEHGQQGYLVEIHDVEGMATRLADLLVDPILRVKLGENGREKYVRQYTTRRYATMMDDILARASGGFRGGQEDRPSERPSETVIH